MICGGHHISIIKIHIVLSFRVSITYEVCIYTQCLCTELIEETGRPPGLIFGMSAYF